MAYAMYNNSSSKRSFFYDVRNLSYGYYGMHPMDQAVVEYQRGRPAAKLPSRQLNRQFKPASIQFEDEQQQQQVLQISVVQQQAKQKQHQFLVLSVGSDDSEPAAASTVTLPESQAVRLVQRLRKLSKWKPVSSGQLPTFGQGLVHEDSVFKAQIVPLTQGAGHGLKILAETRARDPQERRELSSVLLPMDSACLTKFRAVLADLVSTETPLYHTESLQVSDGSKFYLDLIREDTAHYLKVSHVTRDFRSIVIVPACDVAALRDLLDSSLRAMQQRAPDEIAKDAKRPKQPRQAGRNSRRRPRFAQRKRRAGANSEEEAEKENENSSSCSGGAATAEAIEKPTAERLQQLPSGSRGGADDGSTVESRPVENGDQTTGAGTVE
ncbi:hypothetical protein BOX15_Mlig008482g1 [Macrostomum lignano]|uniref:Uncharacterized protein n=1 Tax=Macrostomum lignano TaxID=282301 RepID=A0A267EGB8_9PLAT|nr:hypothetical protein BOX15_Mlig008482g1 [Macrostomum lignano]